MNGQSALHIRHTLKKFSPALNYSELNGHFSSPVMNHDLEISNRIYFFNNLKSIRLRLMNGEYASILGVTPETNYFVTSVYTFRNHFKIFSQ